MDSPTLPSPVVPTGPPPGPDGRYPRELFWQTLRRQVLLYFLPLLLLGAFFHFQYRRLSEESRRAHLEVIAEHQANTLDLFLLERLANLSREIDRPAFRTGFRDPAVLDGVLEELRRTSRAFVDVGVVDGGGDLLGYRGPVTFEGVVNYRGEEWFGRLREGADDAVITDVHLGFRHSPHFTIAVQRAGGGRRLILRSALSPDRIREFLSSLEGAGDVHAFVVNGKGMLQVVTPRGGLPLTASPHLPPRTPGRGFIPEGERANEEPYAYAWLRQVPWALVVQESAPAAGTAGRLGTSNRILLITVAFFAATGGVILLRARQLVRQRISVERHEADLSGQLVHAARLASVGELAAGIAHEINNPLAIIAEEVGILRDSLDPAFAGDEVVDLPEHLGHIHEAVFRCRDITRKLLTFVRKAEVRVAPLSVAGVVDDVVDGMLGTELANANVVVERDYDPAVRELLTDRNQFVQVLVNLVKNALDAMPGGGVLAVRTEHRGDRARVEVKDTGTGITPEQMQRLFVPFFTTKAPGRGTGLGLSVSYHIVRNFGGEMFVESAPGRGSVFTVELPYSMG